MSLSLTGSLSFILIPMCAVPWCCRLINFGGARVIFSKEMDTAILVQILDKAVCISHSSNTLGKGENPTILPPAMSFVDWYGNWPWRRKTT